MSIDFISLASGSNGNCYYVGDEEDAVLIDAGISCRETENRMRKAGLSIQKVRAVFISHEHTDHTAGAEVISRKYGIPVYISEPAYNNSRLKFSDKLLVHLSADSYIQIGEFTVNPFPKLHDSADPLSFILSANGCTFGVFTDIGKADDRLIEKFSKCNAAFLEANYDEKMLLEGRYPWFLKNRIHGDRGHLSNQQALDLFVSHRSPKLSHLLLSHLSKDNNNPELVLDLFRQHAGNTHIEIASRDQESPVYSID